MNVGRRLLGTAVHDGKIYAFGGSCEAPEWYSDATEVYDPKTDKWT